MLVVDIATLYFSSSVVAGFLGIPFLVFTLLHKGTPGIVSWAVAYLLLSAGLLATVYGAFLSRFVQGFVVNMMFISAMIGFDFGLRDEPKRRIDLFDVAILVVAGAVLLWFVLIGSGIPRRLATMLSAVAVVSVRTAVRVTRSALRSTAGEQTAHVALSFFFGLVAVTLVSAVLVTPFAGPIRTILEPTVLNALLVPIVMLFLIGSGMSYLWGCYMRAYGELERTASIDPLTGVRNRRSLMPELERLFARAKRESRPLAVVMLDADSFKAINDTHGHQKGDTVLERLARRISEAVREYDLVARYGGEEFVIVLADMEADRVVALTERLRSAVRATRFDGIGLTVSLGIAFIGDDDQSTDDLLRRADDAMYRAKRSGGDRVAVAGNR
ncbi:MAG: GGDEF domain-containing protein [Spirochaetaceae bacterium]|nr:MAG: GGDEF domain-containing protein [Spirochaetaceae bacterium]